MKKTLSLIVFILWSLTASAATQLVGTLRRPDGASFTGKLYISLPLQARVASGSVCRGPQLIAPNTPIIVNVTNGVMQNPPILAGQDCMIAPKINYKVSLRDPQSNELFASNWHVEGPSIDIGTLYTPPPGYSNTALQVVYGVGVPANPCPQQTMYVQTDATSGQNVWYCINSVYVKQLGNVGPVGPTGCLLSGADTCSNVVATNPLASQTVAQPTNTYLNVNNLQMYGAVPRLLFGVNASSPTGQINLVNTSSTSPILSFDSNNPNDQGMAIAVNYANSKLGFQIASGAAINTHLCGNNSYYTSCPDYYQFVAVNGINQVQKPILDFSSRFNLSATGSTEVDLATVGSGGSCSYCNLNFDAYGRVTSVSSNAGISFQTCNSNGCYWQLPDGTKHAFGTSSVASPSCSSCTVSIVFPVSFVNNPIIEATALGTPVGDGNTHPMTCQILSRSTTAAVAIINLSQQIGGSGYSHFSGTETCMWTADGQ